MWRSKLRRTNGYSKHNNFSEKFDYEGKVTGVVRLLEVSIYVDVVK